MQPPRPILTGLKACVVDNLKIVCRGFYPFVFFLLIVISGCNCGSTSEYTETTTSTDTAAPAPPDVFIPPDTTSKSDPYIFPKDSVSYPTKSDGDYTTGSIPSVHHTKGKPNKGNVAGDKMKPPATGIKPPIIIIDKTGNDPKDDPTVSDRLRNSLKEISGQMLVVAPDSVRVFKPERITVRLAKSTLPNERLVKKLDTTGYKTSVDSIKLSAVMKVTLKEANNEGQVDISLLSCNEYLAVDTTRYSEWVFKIYPKRNGIMKFLVVVSAMVKTDFGNYEEGMPIFEKDIFIYALTSDKLKMFGSRYYWGIAIALILLAGIIIKLIPKQIIIEHIMPNSNKTNFWAAGSLGLLIYVITIVSIIVFRIMDVSLLYALLVLIGTILIYTIFTAVSLRDSGKLSETSFLKLMGIALRKIPPLNLFFNAEQKPKPIKKRVTTDQI